MSDQSTILRWNWGCWTGWPKNSRRWTRVVRAPKFAWRISEFRSRPLTMCWALSCIFCNFRVTGFQWKHKKTFWELNNSTEKTAEHLGSSNMFKHAQTIWNSFDSSRTLAQNYCEPMAFRKPHLKEKLQAWNLTEAKAKAFKMFNAMIAPCVFFAGAYTCIYWQKTDSYSFKIQNVSSCHVNSSVFISPNIHLWSLTNPMVSAWTLLGCRTFWNFSKSNGTGLRKNGRRGIRRTKTKIFRQRRLQTGRSLGIKMGRTNEREVKKHKHQDNGSKITLSRHQNKQSWERHVFRHNKRKHGKIIRSKHPAHREDWETNQKKCQHSHPACLFLAE